MTRIISLIFLILIISMGWTLAWFFGASRIETEIKNFLQSTTQSELQLSCGRLNVSGFPFRIDVTCADAKFSDGDLTITVPNLTVNMVVYRPTHALVFATGPATFKDSFTGSSRELRWNFLRASFRLNGWALARFSVEAENLEVIDTLIGEKRVAQFGRIEAHLLDIPDAYNAVTRRAQWDLLARFDDAEIPEFGIDGATSILEARIESIPDDVRLITPGTLANNWFETDTGVEITKFIGNDNQSEFEFNGRFSATEQARLTGDFGLSTQNIAQRLLATLDPLLVQIILGFPDEGGDYNQSFSLRHGVLLAGNLPVLTLPALQ